MAESKDTEFTREQLEHLFKNPQGVLLNGRYHEAIRSLAASHLRLMDELNPEHVTCNKCGNPKTKPKSMCCWECDRDSYVAGKAYIRYCEIPAELAVARKVVKAGRKMRISSSEVYDFDVAIDEYDKGVGKGE